MIKYKFISLLILLLLCSSCDALFPPRTLDVTFYPQNEGYLAYFQISRKEPVLVIQSTTSPKKWDSLFEQWKNENKAPKVLILALINKQLIDWAKESKHVSEVEEFHYPDINEPPEYLSAFIKQLKKKKIDVRRMRQSRYIPLKDAEAICIAPPEKENYDFETRLSFKFISGKTSFILIPDLTISLIKNMKNQYGRMALRTDVLAVNNKQDIMPQIIKEVFSSPQVLDLSSQTKSSAFKTNGESVTKV